ncbi:ankyrin repeat domain-containing protein 26-like, partial [Pteropus medius]|uniref:ankyrin repeat domain-containing protein 26-like n=1 Tax=Pteropus vampyrus TaxID=132908 RepID=UPI00196BAACB
ASESHEKGKGLLHENIIMRDEIAMLRLEIDMLKIQKLEVEKKYWEEIINVQNKDDHLQKTIKLHEKTVFHHNEQLNVLRAENTMLKSKLENETRNKERLETEVESYCSRLATALHDREQGQMSKRDLELAFQRTKYEWFCLRDRMDFDMSNLKDQNEILSQQLFKVGSKFNSLEIELDQTRDALREKSLVLERVQMELSQTQCQKKEIELKYQHEQGKAIKHTEKLESSEERLSQLQNENVLLQQQVDDAHCKADDQEKAVSNMQEQLQDTIKTLQAKHEKQGHMLDERNREIINEFIHLNKRGYRLENNKLKREVSIQKVRYFSNFLKENSE